SGKRMDDDEDIQYSARGVAADPDDVLFSGNRATQPEYDEYDPLLNGHSVTEPVAAAAAATAVTQTWAASADPIMQTPPMPGAEPVAINKIDIMAGDNDMISLRHNPPDDSKHLSAPCGIETSSGFIQQ
ncbi:DNA translocase FtsK, partial [Salmonella enterica subsp. enterica serovar Heidelberg str. RI-11-013374]